MAMEVLETNVQQQCPPQVDAWLKEHLQGFSMAFTISDLSQPDMPIVYASPQFCELTGYYESEVIGRNCRFLQGPLTERRKVLEIRDALREERTCQVCLLNYRKDGTPFWNQFYLAPIRNKDGRVIHYVGIQTDVTPLVKASTIQRDLTQAQAGEPSETPFAAAAVLAADSVKEVVGSGAAPSPVDAHVSGAASTSSTSAPGTARSAPPTSGPGSTSPAPASTSGQHVQQQHVQQQEASQATGSGRRPDAAGWEASREVGHMRHAYTAPEPLAAVGSDELYKLCMQDHTELCPGVSAVASREAAGAGELQRALSSEPLPHDSVVVCEPLPCSLLQALVQVQQSFVLADPTLPDMPIVHASDTFLQLTGYTREEVVGRNCRFLQGPGTDPEQVAALRAAVTGPSPQPMTVTLLNYCKDGTPFWNSLHVAPVRDAAGRVVFFIGVQLDISQTAPAPQCTSTPAAASTHPSSAAAATRAASTSSSSPLPPLPPYSPAASAGLLAAAAATTTAGAGSFKPPPLTLSMKMAHKGITGAVRVAVRSLGGNVGLRRSCEYHGLPQCSSAAASRSQSISSEASAASGLNGAVTGSTLSGLNGAVAGSSAAAGGAAAATGDGGRDEQ